MTKKLTRCPIDAAVIFEGAAKAVAYPKGLENSENPDRSAAIYEQLIMSNSQAMEKTGDQTLITGAQFLRYAML